MRPPGSNAAASTTTKPPPIARDASDREWMERWLNAALDQIFEIQNRELAEEVHRLATAIERDQPDLRQQVSDYNNSVGAVIDAAARGDLDPARERYPELAAAGMLKLPARPGPGKRFSKPRPVPDDDGPLTEAVWDAAKIRVIWDRHYPHRPRHYDSPEAMAARRHDVDEDRVRSWAKSRRCMKIPSHLLDI
jgi:hypothetical protein